MATIQTNSNWEQKQTVKKGNLGELIVRRFLESKGLVVYKPVTDKAHSFDMLAILNKKTVMIAEVKSKALMKFCKCTGFNYSTYEDYKYIAKKHNLRVFIFFVDEELAKIYGNWLDVLDNPIEYEGYSFPLNKRMKNGNLLRLYHYNSMVQIADIAWEEAELLKHYSYSNWKK